MLYLFILTWAFQVTNSFSWTYNPFLQERNILVRRSFYSVPQWSQTQLTTPGHRTYVTRNPNDCYQSPIAPPDYRCRQLYPSSNRFYYNTTSRTCEPHTFLGCERTPNNFDNLHECETVCGVVQDRCNLPAESGRCLSYLRMYHYDPDDDTCKLFTYGGCEGNENRFRTRQECEVACKKGLSDVEQIGQMGQEQGEDLTDEGKCTLPPESGRCLASMKRYFYDPEDDRCKIFTYGGCGGNPNKYRTKEECEETCRTHGQKPWGPSQQGIPPLGTFEQAEDLCNLPPESGTCYGSFEKFYYDSSSRECRTFIYGGCRGNRNNFQSLEECQQICGFSQPIGYPPEMPPLTTVRPAYQPDIAVTSPGFSIQQPVGPVFQPIPPIPPTDLVSPIAGGAQRQCDVSQCPWNTWAHYTERDCQPVYQEGQCCPSRFECPKAEIGRQTNECVYKNRLYPVGADVNVSDSCQVCVCQGFPGEAGKINCASVECPEGFMPPPQGCYSLYEENQCCAVGRACEGPGSARDENNQCNYGGRFYHYGQRIYFDDDPCMECICSRNFRGPGGPGCTKVQCHMELKEETFRLGCVPIYHPNVCCPIDWRCPQTEDIQQSSDDIQSGAQATDICTLRPLRGPCRSTKPRFYFDADLGRCQTFIYGGCQGNENNFQTLSECEQRCANRNQEPEFDICSLSPEKGPCKASRTRFYFDSIDGSCKNFVYGGCQGNANNFATREQCLAQCGRANRDELCLLSSDSGPCRAEKPRYYYDSQTQQCKQFIYGGCQGNENNFHSLYECQQRCSGVAGFKQEAPSTIDPLCYLEPERGSCKASRNRFYYDAEIGDCRNFTYGGCQGNENNFLTYQLCYARCVLPSQRVETPDPVCQFGGKTYPLGHSLATEDPCVECTCKTPPMMTCIHQVCPSIPNDDYENCTPINEPGKCCTEYVCTTPSISTMIPSGNLEEHLCKNFSCNEGQICQLQDAHCQPPNCRPRCVSEIEAEIVQNVQKVIDKVPCPVPSCPGHCRVGDVPGLRCPTCVCAKTKEEACDNFDCPSGYQCDVDEEKCEAGDCTPLCRTSALQLETDLCSLPAQRGPCRKNQFRFYYDVTTNQCKEFSYGGCKGNANNFETKDQCLKKCGSKPERTPITVTDDICVLPKHPGQSCSSIASRELRYYYNSTFGFCSIFLYNGCGGNENKFDSRQDCEKACFKTSVTSAPSVNRRVTTPTTRLGEDCKNCNCSVEAVTCRTCCRSKQEANKPNDQICSLPKEPGHCVTRKTTSLKYYYNSALDYCGVFVYSGCGGNANQFETRRDCEAKCMVEAITPSQSITNEDEVFGVDSLVTPVVAEQEEKQTSDFCTLPPEKGPCRALITRFYFDSSDSSCKTFIFGGCLGNKNNFETKQQCLEKCSSFRPEIAGDVCSLPKAPGECQDSRRSAMKFYYDPDKKQCFFFLYSGCGGNDNRFDSRDDCERTCLHTLPNPPSHRDTEHVTNNLEEICKRLHCPRGYTCVLNEACLTNCRPQCKRITEVDQSLDETSVDLTDRCPRLRCSYPCSTILTPGKCPVCNCETEKADPCLGFRCLPGTTCQIDPKSCKRGRCLPVCKSNEELFPENTADNEAEICKDIVCAEGLVCSVDTTSCLRGKCEPVCSDTFEQQSQNHHQQQQQQHGY